MAAITAAALIAIASACGPAAAADAKASRLYEDALVRYEKQDYAGAVIQLKNAIKVDGRMLPVHVLLGKSLLANGDVAAAEVAFGEALQLGVDRAEVALPLARVYIAQGRPREVLDQPRLAPQGLPASTQAQLLLLRAAAQADVGEAKAALQTLDQARTIDPTLAPAWVAEVPIRIRARQWKEALFAADKAVALAPALADGQYMRGTVLHVQGDRAGALAAYGRALQVEPRHTEALVSRAGLLIDAGRDADAASDVAELLRASPRDPRGQYLRSLLADRRHDTAAVRGALHEVTALLDPLPLEYLRYRPQVMMLGGLAHYGLNQKEKALPYLEGVQRLQPGSPVSKLLAQIYLSQNNLDRAIESLEAYLRAQPADSQALQLLASAHMSQGRYVRAAQLMQDALRQQPRSDPPALHALLGLSLIGGGKVGDATAELEAAVKRDPGQIQAGSALATIYMQQGQAAKAVRIADAMVKQQPKNPGVLNVAGLAKASSGDAVGARAAFEAASQLDPRFAAPQVNLARLDRASRDPDRAIARLQALLKADPNDVDAMTELGLAHDQRGAADEAQRWLEKAADMSGPRNLEPALALVEFHLRLQRVDGAREASKRLVAKAPDDTRVLLVLARVALAGGDLPAARTSLTRAANGAGGDAPMLVQIALVQLQADHLAGAAYTVDKALSQQPDHLPAQALMAEIELRQGEPAKAEKRARQIVTQYPKLGVGHALLGDIARSRNDVAASIDHYRRAHAVEQSGASLLRLCAAQAVSDPRGAQQAAEQWLRSHPRDAAVTRALADQQARNGNYAAARDGYQAVLKLTPADAEAMNNLAHTLILTGDNAGALKAAQAALALDGRKAHIIGTAGWASFKAGQTDRGLQMLRDARLRDPANLDTRYYLSAVLASVGRKAEAREELEAALASGNRNFVNAKQAESLLASLK